MYYNIREAFEAAKELYLESIDDDDKTELTYEEAEELLRLIGDIADDASSPVFPGDVIHDIVDELIELFPRLHESDRRIQELREGEGRGYIPQTNW